MPQSEIHLRFCVNARTIRLRKKLTQKQVAEKMDRSTAYVTELETGRHCPTLEVVARYAEALGVDPVKLLEPAKILIASA